MNRELFIGLISGTSRDGVDAALVDFSGPQPALLASHCVPFAPELRRDLDRLIELRRRPQRDEYSDLDARLGAYFAGVALALLEHSETDPREVRAVGSHGQTVWHEPEGENPVTLQLGSARVIAERTGMTVVSDFRTADLAAGGQGAPLAPLLHQALFNGLTPCAVLNLGGISNLTVLGNDGTVIGFDTGPANCLMDAWCARHLGSAYDENGEWAASGTLLPSLLGRMLDEPYFALSPPKSTGLELFNLDWLQPLLPIEKAPPVNVQRTLLELTVQTVAADLRKIPSLARVMVCGGGIHNAALMEHLRRHLPDLTIESTSQHGVDPDWVEAMLFAWLARERLAERKMETGSVTGARHPVLLGTITEA